MARKTYLIQERGQVTLPAKLRKKYGLKKGDAVVFRETEEGILISAKETAAMKLLDELGEKLQAEGVTLEQLMASGREERAKLLKSMYDIESGDED
jgi:AbrB family looped-hinge helix DNA binding protein